MSILKEDLKYEELEETIYYRSSDDTDVMLICERSWRAVLEDIYINSRSFFTFVLKRVLRGIEHPLPTVLY